MSDLLGELRQEDRELDASVRLMFSRLAVRTAVVTASLPRALEAAAVAAGAWTIDVGMSFWTDAAILGEAGIPSVLFGPGGAGLHSSGGVRPGE